MSRPLHLIPTVEQAQRNLALASRVSHADLIRSTLLNVYVHEHPWVEFEVALTGRIKLVHDDDKVHFILKCT